MRAETAILSKRIAVRITLTKETVVEKAIELSPSLEDYLEAIHLL